MRTPPSVYDNNKGFTLVELAISLMIIGLLIAGVLKGDELIENARTTKYVREFKEYDTATNIFLSTYDNFPGDMPNPERRIPDCTAAPCNVSGNGDGLLGGLNTIPNSTTILAVSSGENRRFWIHLTKTGLIQKKINADYSGAYSNTIGIEVPAAAEKDVMIVAAHYANSATWGSPPLATANYYVLRKIVDHPVTLHGWRAASIDQKMDDGLPGTGEVRAGSGNTPAPPYADCVTGTEYNVTSPNVGCNLIVKMN